jgi:hypothetical protein
MACSPDGKIVYFVARGVVWAIPSSASSAGSQALKIRAGDSVAADPSGRRLDGSSEKEIPTDASIRKESSD